MRIEKKFIYDGVVTGKNFCARKNEIARLLSYINDSTNVLLIAKRRVGKTSLIHEIFENHLPDKKFIKIYSDIFDITDEFDFAKILYQSVAKALKLDFSIALKTIKNLFQKASFEFSIGADGNPSFSPKFASQNYDELLEDVFNGLFEYLSRHNLKAAFCIDEFQQIKKIKRPLDATIRKYIQKHHNVSYIFTGSKRNTLTKLFKGEKSPLMGMVTPMELGPIDVDDFYSFAKERIKSLSKEEFRKIFELSEGESKLIQHILRNMLLLVNEGKKADADISIQMVLNEVDSMCRNIIETLSANSRKVIKMILETEGRKSIISKEILQKFNISKSSVESALKSLEKEEIIFKDNNIYYIDGGIGSTFSLWCKNKLI